MPKPRSASQIAADLAFHFLKEKKKPAIGGKRRRESDFAEYFARSAGTNRTYLFWAAELADKDSLLLALVREGRLTITQARRALSLKKTNQTKYALLLNCNSRKEAKQILGRAKKPIDPVKTIKQLYRASDGKQRQVIKKWILRSKNQPALRSIEWEIVGPG